MEESFIKQMSEMKDKADKYEHLKKRYDEIAEKLKEINNSIYGLLTELKPETMIVSKRQRRSDGDIEVFDYAIKFMKTGKYLNLKELYKAFPDRTEGSLSQIFYIAEDSENIIYEDRK